MENYKKRILDDDIERRLKNKGAILVEGAKWCGKTTTCETHAESILYMDGIYCPPMGKSCLQ